MEEVARQIGIGLAKGAELSGMNIIGGETATLKGIINGIDLAGTCLGYVHKDKIITGEYIAEGDAIVGLASSGVHSNGLTLARKVVEKKGLSFKDPYPGTEHDGSIGEILLTPTRIYVKEILGAIKDVNVHGLSNITGGGLRNIVRLKENVLFNITEPLPVPEIFSLLAEWGSISTEEMYQTFNMGLGFCAVVPAPEADDFIQKMPADLGAKIIGTVESGSGLTVESLKLRY
jgi:phosphoribosylformylglycinamidine cyclo-ligase